MLFLKTEQSVSQFIHAIGTRKEERSKTEDTFKEEQEQFYSLLPDTPESTEWLLFAEKHRLKSLISNSSSTSVTIKLLLSSLSTVSNVGLCANIQILNHEFSVPDNLNKYRAWSYYYINILAETFPPINFVYSLLSTPSNILYLEIRWVNMYWW